LPVLSGNPPPSDPAAVEQARESWINDGVSLAIAVARQLRAFRYGDNEPGRSWSRITGRLVRPQALRRPAHVVVLNRDRIVPPGSGEPLAGALDTTTILRRHSAISG